MMSNKEIYSKLCSQRKDIPIFSQPWWLDTVCAHWDVAIVKKGEHIAGVWPYPVEKKIGVTMIRTPMLTPYMGPLVFYPHDLKESNNDSYEHETVAALIKQLPNAPVWHLSIQPGLKQAGIFKANKLHSQVQQTFLLELKEDEETLLTNMKDAVRRNIRIAESEVTVTNSPEHLKDLFKFQKNTLSKKGKSFNYSLKDLKTIMDAGLANNSTALWVAKTPDKKILAIVWAMWDGTTSYYFMGGQNPEANSYRAMSLLLWHTMRLAKERGNSIYDLEGSMDEGVERFFRNFGGDRALYIILMKNKSLIWKLKQMIFK
jgi:lipid II:glycine glycyltransferase (peptidoglycan interpeptide bridge formation enzyme)